MEPSVRRRGDAAALEVEPPLTLAAVLRLPLVATDHFDLAILALLARNL
jgi:hypothetical protein